MFFCVERSRCNYLQWAEPSGVRTPIWTRFSLPWGPQSPLKIGYHVSFLEIKRPGRGVDPPPCADVENEYLYLPTVPALELLRCDLYLYILYMYVWQCFRPEIFVNFCMSDIFAAVTTANYMTKIIFLHNIKLITTTTTTTTTNNNNIAKVI